MNWGQIGALLYLIIGAYTAYGRLSLTVRWVIEDVVPKPMLEIRAVRALMLLVYIPGVVFLVALWPLDHVWSVYDDVTQKHDEHEEEQQAKAVQW